MARRPTGTVTFLFTDVEGSTELWSAHPSQMRVAMEEHDRIVRSTIESNSGYVFSTAGDAFAAAFQRVDDAANAASVIQVALAAAIWPEPVVLRARVGLHTGDAHERGGDYFGTTLNRAARIMSAAHGGQTVVSNIVSGLLETAELRDLGEYRLKGLGGLERIWQLGNGSFAPLRTTDAAPGNLPRHLSSFVGRDDELLRVRQLLEDHRSVTLLGPGGLGKTRLAIESASALGPRFPGGIWLTELAAVRAGQVTSTIASTTGALPSRTQSAEESIASWAAQNPGTLLVLDNCEHLPSEVASLATMLLEASESLTILATSRSRLHVAGEIVFEVPPLDQGPALFLQRVREADAGFELSGDEVTGVATLCEHLDGLPLAIELAASRFRSLSISQILDGLSQRFRVLRGDDPGASDRHATLQAVVRWSYDLLDSRHQQFFDLLGIFRGEFTHELATDIVRGDPAFAEVDQFDVIDLLQGLVDRSMVVSSRSQGSVKFRLLDTFRAFGRERLEASEKLDSTRDVHFAHYVGVAREASAGLLGADEPMWVERIRIEAGELLSAIQWARSQGDLQGAANIIAGLHQYALWRQWVELAHESDLVLAAAETTLGEHSTLHAISGWGCWMRGDYDQAHSLVEAARAAETEGVEPTGWLFDVTAHCAFVAGDDDAGLDALDEAIAFARQSGDRALLSYLLGDRALHQSMGGPSDIGRQQSIEAGALASALRNPTLLALGRMADGWQHRFSDPVLAVQRLLEAADLAEAVENTWIRSRCRAEVATLLSLDADPDSVLPAVADTLENYFDNGDMARVRNEIRRALIVLDRAGRIEPDHLLLLQATTEHAPRFRNAIIDEALSKIVHRIRQDHDDLTTAERVSGYTDEQAAVDDLLQLLRG